MNTYKLSQNPCLIIRTTDSAYIPVDPHNGDYRAYLSWVALGNTPDPADLPLKYSPDIISMRQCRLQLNTEGTLTTVTNAITALGTVAQITWNSSTQVVKQDPMFQQIAAQLGKTAADIDLFFTNASKL